MTGENNTFVLNYNRTIINNNTLRTVQVKSRFQEVALSRLLIEAYSTTVYDVYWIFDFSSMSSVFHLGQKVLIVDELEDVECLEGDTVTFRCRICPSDYIGVKWYLDETLLYTNDLNEIQMVPGGYHTLTFKELARKDTGTISFLAGDKRSYASLLVRGEALACVRVVLCIFIPLFMVLI